MYKISLAGSSSFFTIGITIFIIAILFERIYSYRKGSKNSKKDLIGIITGAIAGVVVIGAIFIMPLFNGIEIEKDVLSAKFISGFTSIQVTDNEILNAKVIDWNEEKEYQPNKRILGTGTGSYKEGKFKLANGESALVYTNSTKVLLVELEDKYLLLAPDNFDDFVQNFDQNIFALNN
ncbi:hypothetical protein SH2C18_07100 [Clostridium sediminicola]|uniref:PH domain-containing protein n=1 Tax=Clostridium sediminicola TaxID=3114879 RepID=UPI0031F24B01